jgi:hypothetical protein
MTKTAKALLVMIEWLDGDLVRMLKHLVFYSPLKATQ